MLLRIICALLLAKSMAIGQSGWTVQFPSNGQIGVSPSASVTIYSSAPVDTAQWSKYDVPFFVVRDSIAQAVGTERRKQHRVAGQFALIDEFTTTWTPRRLLPNTAYRCILGNQEYVYTTAPDVSSVVGCTMPVGAMRCDQQIEIVMTSPLPPGCDPDSVIIVEQLTPASSWSNIPSAITFDDHTARIVPIDRWQPNAQLRVRVRCSWYAGDVGLDRTYEGMVRGATTVVCNGRLTSGEPITDEYGADLHRNSRVGTSGDTIYLSAPRVVGPNLCFSHWESRDVPSINGDTTPVTQFLLSCETMNRFCAVTAVYRRLDSVRIRCTVEGGEGRVKIYRISGEFVHEITDSAHISVALHDGPLLCVASSAQTSTLLGWMYQGRKLQTGAIVIPTKRAAPMSSISVNPKFHTLQPSMQDIYRLRGSITDVDADPLFNVAGAVRFTTPYEYESSTPATRTLCVTAQRCWEIIGYLDQSVGTPIWFEQGLQEYCITSELLKPENHVVFFARRKMIDLRVESVLLGSENPNDILKNRSPHPETRIEIQREQDVAGQREWVSLTSTNCVIDGVSTARFQVACGDNLRIIVHPATQRGQQWRWWNALPKYVVPAGNSGTQPSRFTLVADTDIAGFDATDCEGAQLGHREIRIQAAFRQQMVIESIGLRVRVNAQGERQLARFEERWFDPLTYYDCDADEPSDGRQLEYIARRGTPIRVRFSLPLDPLSVYNNSVSAESFDNILLTEPHAEDLDFHVYADTSGNTNLLSSTGQFLDIVEFFVCEPHSRPRKQALHTGAIDLTIRTSIHSYTGDPLRAAQTFALRRMEMPGFGMKLRTMMLHDDGDWDLWPFVNRGEIYHAVYGGDLTPRRALLTDQGFTRMPSCDEQQGSVGECTTLHGDTDGPLSFGDHALWLQTLWMGQADLAWVRLTTWDEDCKDENDCLVNRMGDVIDSLRVRAAKYNVPVEMAALDWKALIPDLIKTGVDIIDALVVPDEQDDFLAECTVLEDSRTLWGMRNAQAPFMSRYHENADYEFRGQWYTARAAVR
jgi:hypothetical protein